MSTENEVKKIVRVRVSATDFLTSVCKASKEGGTVADVATELNVGIPAVSARMSVLRKKGFNIPELTRRSGGSGLNVEEANKLIASLIE